MRVRFKIYRFLVRTIFAPLIELARGGSSKAVPHLDPPEEGFRRLWFHASSVGELESGIPVLEEAIRRKFTLVVTVFSRSAEENLNRLQERFGGQLEFAGLSPVEGKFGEALSRLCPDFFLTTKYEAWPELWGSLSERELPLGILSAQSRRSLRVAKKILRFLGVPLPELVLFAPTISAGQTLKQEFPEAKVQWVDDPRWERVLARNQKTGSAAQKRVAELCTAFENAPRPWGVLGQIWMEDLKFLEQVLKTPLGTFWIVPHENDAKTIEAVRKFFAELGKKTVLSSTMNSEKPDLRAFPLIDEKGFLAELYRVVDWAYVGGGFSKGIHSTIEPAVHGLPLACGPKNVPKFSETGVLRSIHQLTVLETSESAQQWFKENAQKLGATQKKELWVRTHQSRSKSSQSILDQITQVLC